MNLTLLALSLAFVLIEAPNALGSISFTPPRSFVQCQPAKLIWSSSGPIFISILPASQSDFTFPSENPGPITPIADFGEQTGSSVTWDAVNVTAGTSIVVALRDETSSITSGSVTVSGGDDNSCLVSDTGTGTGRIISTYSGELSLR